jgi:hypothetical protein
LPIAPRSGRASVRLRLEGDDLAGALKVDAAGSRLASRAGERRRGLRTIGDTLETTVTVYAHEFDSRRRSRQRLAALEARYGEGMATHTPQQTATDEFQATAETVDLQAVRSRAR